MPEQIDYLLKTTWQNVMKMYNHKAKQYGISSTLAMALISIHPKTGSTLSDVAKKLGIAPSSNFRSIKKLEGMNLINKCPNQEDAREINLTLTEKGILERNKAKQIILGFNQLLYDNLTQFELDAFYKVIEKINLNIDQFKYE